MKNLLKAIILTVLLTAALLPLSVSAEALPANDKLMSKLGFTKARIEEILNSDSAEEAAALLPPPPGSGSIYRSSELKTEDGARIIDINYDEGGEFYRGGNGLFPFTDSFHENNALLMFCAADGLREVNFKIHFNNIETGEPEHNHTVTFAVEDIADYFGKSAYEYFGDFGPPRWGVNAIYEALSANLQPSEYYFAHYSRLYLGDESEMVEYRMTEPASTKFKKDNSPLWTSGDGNNERDVYKVWHYEYEVGSGSKKFFFNSDSFSSEWIVAKSFFPTNGKNYEEITEALGDPSFIKELEDGRQFIGYSLKEEIGRVHGRTAYYILQNGTVVEEGLMLGEDYGMVAWDD